MDNLTKDLKVTTLILILFISMTVSTKVTENKFYKEYPDSTLAVLTEQTSENYLYAPYHGGVVQERTKYCTKYTYGVDSSEYTFTIESTIPVNNITLSILYNEDNPLESFYNYNETRDYNGSVKWLPCLNCFKSN